MHPEEIFTYAEQKICTGMVTEPELGNSQKLETTSQMPIDKRIDKV